MDMSHPIEREIRWWDKEPFAIIGAHESSNGRDVILGHDADLIVLEASRLSRKETLEACRKIVEELKFKCHGLEWRKDLVQPEHCIMGAEMCDDILSRLDELGEKE